MTRGREHTTLTETARTVVRELEKLPGIKMIAPGEIRTTNRRTSGKRFLTIVLTNAGMELLITGQSVQKVAVHTDHNSMDIVNSLSNAKRLQDFTITVRERYPN